MSASASGASVTIPLHKLPRKLLILDDRTDVLRALDRYMQLYFECVVLARTPPEAEAELGRLGPCYLLCDCWLGDEYPPATAFLLEWRARYPNLLRVALMTGSRLSSVPENAAIDAVFKKPLDMHSVVDFFSA